MTTSSLREIRKRLIDTFGLNFRVSTTRETEGLILHIAPTDLSASEGFSVRVTVGWRHLRAEFIPGSFARPLLQEMAGADEESRLRSMAFARGAELAGITLEMKLNRQYVDPTEIEAWTGEWNQMSVTAISENVALNPEHEDELIQHILRVVEPVMGMVLSLLPVEEVNQEEEGITGLPEGAVQRMEVNRYERSRLNRAACIAVRGRTCAVCGFDFERVYGPLGRGFIHVHHVIPVSQLGPDYRIDPVRDLVPVCPNCHAMLHRRVPPLSVEELRSMMVEQGQETTHS